MNATTRIAAAISTAGAAITLTACSSFTGGDGPTPAASAGQLRPVVEDYAATISSATTIEQNTAAYAKFGVPACAEMMKGFATAFIGSTGDLPNGPQKLTVKAVDQTSPTTGTSEFQEESGDPYTFHWEVVDGRWQFNCKGQLDVLPRDVVNV